MNYNTCGSNFFWSGVSIPPAGRIVFVMKSRLEQLEARLQALIENGAARLFLFGDSRNDLGSRLVAEMKANIHTQADGSFWAPNLYFLVLSPDQAQALQNEPARLDELALILQKVAAQAGLRFATPPMVKTLMEPALRADEVQILAKFNLDVLLETSAIEVPQAPAGEKAAPDAYLIVNGSQIFPLDKAVLNIGRSTNNDIVLDDLKVSRSHAQLRLINSRYVIFDLDSTGGTFVNEKRVTQNVLYPGDVISIAGVPLIFGQEPKSSGETREFILPHDEPDQLHDHPGKPDKGI
jgi:hypothetical protein